MSKPTIAGIQRYTLFSPNHVGNDAAIFTATADLLREAGYKVNIYTEQEFLANDLEEKYVFTMLRDEKSVQRLAELEAGGVKAVNSSSGIRNCVREQMTDLLLKNNIPYPDSVILNTGDKVSEYTSGKRIGSCWIKRGDFHAIHKEDVTYIRKPEEIREVMAEYALRGIDRVVINDHLHGDLIKFYGVAGTDFFHWFYPFDRQHSKFGHEDINGKPVGIDFSVDSLKDICNAAADVLEVAVYGGDCIVSPDGVIRIIDFNDWPSFAPCREEASCAIAETIERVIQENE